MFWPAGIVSTYYSGPNRHYPRPQRALINFRNFPQIPDRDPFLLILSNFSFSNMFGNVLYIIGIIKNFCLSEIYSR